MSQKIDARVILDLSFMSTEVLPWTMWPSSVRVAYVLFGSFGTFRRTVIFRVSSTQIRASSRSTSSRTSSDTFVGSEMTASKSMSAAGNAFHVAKAAVSMSPAATPPSVSRMSSRMSHGLSGP